MRLRNDAERANAQRKLDDIERLIEQAKRSSPPGRDAELRSLTRLANQLREELIRCNASPRATAPQA